MWGESYDADFMGMPLNNNTDSNENDDEEKEEEFYLCSMCGLEANEPSKITTPSALHTPECPRFIVEETIPTVIAPLESSPSSPSSDPWSSSASERIAKAKKLQQQQEDKDRLEANRQQAEIETKRRIVEDQRLQRLKEEAVAREKKLQADEQEQLRKEWFNLKKKDERLAKEDSIRKKQQARLEREKEARRQKIEQTITEQPLHAFLQEMGIPKPSLGKHDFSSTMPRSRRSVSQQKKSSPRRPPPCHKPFFAEESLSSDNPAVKAAAAAMAERVFQSLDELKKRDAIVKELQQQLTEAMAQVAAGNSSVSAKRTMTSKKQLPPIRRCDKIQATRVHAKKQPSPPPQRFALSNSLRSSSSPGKFGSLRHKFLVRSSQSMSKSTGRHKMQKSRQQKHEKGRRTEQFHFNVPSH